MTRHTISKTFASESDGSNLATGAAWQRNTCVDIPNRVPRAARHRVNQEAPSVAGFALFIRREVFAENRGRSLRMISMRGGRFELMLAYGALSHREIDGDKPCSQRLFWKASICDHSGQRELLIRMFSTIVTWDG